MGPSMTTYLSTAELIQVQITLVEPYQSHFELSLVLLRALLMPWSDQLGPVNIEVNVGRVEYSLSQP